MPKCLSMCLQGEGVQGEDNLFRGSFPFFASLVRAAFKFHLCFSSISHGNVHFAVCIQEACLAFGI